MNTGYSVTDPGYETIEPVEDELAALKAENTKAKPSETSGDVAKASKAKGKAEESETPAGDDASDSQSADPFDDISDELLDRAIAVGYELDDIRDLKDAKAFEREVARAERLKSRIEGKKQTGNESADDPEQTPESKEPDWGKMIEDGHDPDIIALQKRNWHRAAAAEAKVRQLEQIEQQRAAQAVIDRFDEVLNGLDEYSAILGKGRRDELTKSSPEAVKNRAKVFETMTILKNGYLQNGRSVPSEAELIEQAVHAAFYKQTQEIARNSIKRQIKNAGSQALSRPRSGSSKELSGEQRALQKEQEFWRTHS